MLHKLGFCWCGTAHVTIADLPDDEPDPVFSCCMDLNAAGMYCPCLPDSVVNEHQRLMRQLITGRAS